MTNDIIWKIRDWAHERHFEQADDRKQTLKMGEECGELCSAYVRGNIDEIKDAIGDIAVVAIVLCYKIGRASCRERV